jgi:hypothetical protein
MIERKLGAIDWKHKHPLAVGATPKKYSIGV